MTPATIAGMCRLSGLDVAALTDHNTCGNCPAFCEAAEAYGLLAIPGMELCTLEEVHVVCLLPDLDRAMAFQAEVYRRMEGRTNDPAIFGRQLLMDVDDNVVGEEPALLAGAASIGVYEAAALAESFGGVAYPAHIDRDSFSLLSNLGLWDPAMGFPLAEVSRRCPPDFARTRRDLRGGGNGHRHRRPLPPPDRPGPAVHGGARPVQGGGAGLAAPGRQIGLAGGRGLFAPAKSLFYLRK